MIAGNTGGLLKRTKRTPGGPGRQRGGSLITRHPLLLCGVFGGLAALFVLLYVGQVNQQVADARAQMLARYGGEQVEVCVATRDIPAGQTLDPSAVAVRVWVADLLPKGAIVDADAVLGRTATAPIAAGEVLCEARFVADVRALEVPEGLVAVSVPAKDVQAVGGAVEPGMCVDVYATGAQTTSLIGGGVLVLATNCQGSEGAAAKSQSIQWITLALPPQSVAEVISAAERMSLYYVVPGEGAGAVWPAPQQEAADISEAEELPAEGQEPAAQEVGGIQQDDASALKADEQVVLR